MNYAQEILTIAEQLEVEQNQRCMGDDYIISQCLKMLDVIIAHPICEADFISAFRKIWNHPDMYLGKLSPSA